jgi:hypothetical protein
MMLANFAPLIALILVCATYAATYQIIRLLAVYPALSTAATGAKIVLLLVLIRWLMVMAGLFDPTHRITLWP